MNQSELIEKVARATELNQAAAGLAVKVVVKRHSRLSRGWFRAGKAAKDALNEPKRASRKKSAPSKKPAVRK